MNELINRYVYDVVKRLDEWKKKDIEKELKANIMDMLGEDFSEENTIKVLKKLGRPDVLALKYKEKKKYVISPRLYDDYIKTLKIVLIVFISINVISSIVSAIFNETGIQVIGTMFEEITEELFGSIFFAFAVVTVVFWAIDYNQKDLNHFDPTKLSKVPTDKEVQTKRVEAIVELVLVTIFGSLFLWLILNSSVHIEGVWDVEPFVYSGRILKTQEAIWLAIMVSIGMLITIGNAIYRIINSKWTITSGIVFSILEFGSLIAFSILLLSIKPFELSFLQSIATASEQPLTTIELYASRFIFGVLAIAWISTVIEESVKWYKLTKTR
ncbi:MAG: hypothetical protein RBQ91_03655 [Acholeplasma sp.]|nr:hypothetical protein [Acholeplasma sp.]